MVVTRTGSFRTGVPSKSNPWQTERGATAALADALQNLFIVQATPAPGLGRKRSVIRFAIWHADKYKTTGYRIHQDQYGMLFSKPWLRRRWAGPQRRSTGAAVLLSLPPCVGQADGSRLRRNHDGETYDEFWQQP
jgi:hypothetical protein